MTPIELLADGLKKGNWDFIQQAYQVLTGDTSIETPQATSYKDMIDQISAIINQTNTEQTNTTDVPREIKIGKTVLITGNCDGSSEENKQPKRNRPVRQVKTYTVECNECNKKFTASRPAGEIGIKCQECLMSK